MKANEEVKTMIIERREFTLGAVLAMLAGATITISGCGGDDPPSSPSTPAPSADKAGQISANHGHNVTISGAQLTAGASVMLTLMGGGHTHTVTLDATEVVQIRNNQRVSKTSSTDSGHTHTVTFN